jgi:hypothetical protein
MAITNISGALRCSNSSVEELDFDSPSLQAKKMKVNMWLGTNGLGTSFDFELSFSDYSTNLKSQHI